MSTYQTTLANLRDIASQILKEYSQDRVFGFFGEMGAGKTTLIKEMCNILEIENVTSSPTFAIINEYWRKNGKPVYHFDFYRIETDKEAYSIGFKDYIDSDEYCFMEWTEKIEHLLHERYIKVEITKINDLMREVTCTIMK
jgi:tRNA threonylcarbamoyladenosine biosynthesis protein TsaE